VKNRRMAMRSSTHEARPSRRPSARSRSFLSQPDAAEMDHLADFLRPGSLPEDFRSASVEELRGNVRSRREG